jgi:polysaccharide deacetylase family protein (PEP-CTERM system associated)
MEAYTNTSQTLSDPADYILSFDVEEHDRIEAAQGVHCPASRRHEYAQRMEARTRDILAWLAAHRQRATFFIVGEVAQKHRKLIREIVAAGHEVAAHGWRHERVDRMTRQQFQDDVRRCKTALEDAAGVLVFGYRAPSFSIGWKTPWVADVLAECGYRYDASIYPVRHDRYGIPEAPRGPFWLLGEQHRLLELPALTWRGLGRNWAVGGGGHFRLWPLAFLHAGLRQAARLPCPVGVLYFHPWEFDPDQPRLPLRGLVRWRTYVGLRRTASRFQTLLQSYRFVRAWDVVEKLLRMPTSLPTFSLGQAASRAA